MTQLETLEVSVISQQMLLFLPLALPDRILLRNQLDSCLILKVNNIMVTVDLENAVYQLK